MLQALEKLQNLENEVMGVLNQWIETQRQLFYEIATDLETTLEAQNTLTPQIKCQLKEKFHHILINMEPAWENEKEKINSDVSITQASLME